MLNKCKRFASKYAYIYLPICTLLCLAGFIGSYLFPNKVLDTYKVNIEEAGDDMEFVQPLTGKEDEIGYLMETDGRIMKGFQIGVCKNGASLEGTELVYRVYTWNEPDKKTEDYPEDIPDVSKLSLAEEGSLELGACLDGQYPYLPFHNEACSGRLYITLTYHANQNTEQAMPGIYMNHSTIANAATYIDGQKAVSDGQTPANVKCYYIYTHNTYPFLYDSRVMLCIFLAASACACYPAFSKKKKEVTVSDEEA